ncbi:MAG: RluA family pseudouridine synthase, partial [Rubrivivax sp.]
MERRIIRPRGAAGTRSAPGKPPIPTDRPAKAAATAAASAAAPQPGAPAAQVQRLRVDEDSAGQRLDNFLLRLLKGVPK